MTLYFENNTTVYPDQHEKEMVMAEADTVSCIVSCMAPGRTSYRNRNAFCKPEWDNYDKVKSNFNLFRADSMLYLTDDEAERIYKYKKYRNRVSFCICIPTCILVFILIRLIFGFDSNRYHYRRFHPEIILYAVIALIAYRIGTNVAKRKYGDKLPARLSENHFNYKFYDEYIVMKNDFDGKVIRYENLRVGEDDSKYYIAQELDLFVLDKNGFSVPHENFKKLMNDKGFEVVPYFGQF